MKISTIHTRGAAILLLVAFITLSGQILKAQSSESSQSISISLNEAIEMGLERNFSVKTAESDLDKSKAQYRQTHAVFLPQISLEYNAISTNDPLNVFGFKLKQQSVTQQDFNPALLNDPETLENYSAKFEVRQPLLNPDMIVQRSAVKRYLLSTDEQLTGTKNFVKFQVREQYYTVLMNHKQLSVIQTALETAGEHRRMAENFYNEGMISREDFLAARVYELEMESRKLHIENEIQSANEELSLLLGLDGSTKIVAIDDLTMIQPPDIDPEQAVSNINNAQTRAIGYRVEAAEQMVKSANFSFLPSVNLFGSYDLNDSELLGFNSPSYMIGANLRWNLFSGFSKAGKVMEARADLQKARTMQQRNRYEQENRVRRAIRSLHQAEKELILTDESIRQSTEDVKIRGNRFKEGMERTTELLEAETRLAESRLKNVGAIFKYNMSIAALEMLLENSGQN
ncbi:MAG: TolC family protein [Balneolaceae bacterium]